MNGPVAPPGYQAPRQASSNLPDNETMAFVAIGLSIASWVMGGIFLSLPGFLIARSEMGKIDRLQVTDKHQNMFKVAYWVALINLVVTLIGLVVFFFVVILMVFGIFGAATLQ